MVRSDRMGTARVGPDVKARPREVAARPNEAPKHGIEPGPEVRPAGEDLGPCAVGRIEERGEAGDGIDHAARCQSQRPREPRAGTGESSGTGSARNHPKRRGEKSPRSSSSAETNPDAIGSCP